MEERINDIFIIYLGRTGGLPKFVLDLTNAITNDKRINNFKLLISNSNLLRIKLKESKSDLFSIDTPIKTIDAILKLPKFIWKSSKIIKKSKKDGNKKFLFTMTHIWNPVLMLLIKIFIKDSNIYYINHDAKLHPGENTSKIQTFIMWLEIFLANKIITLTQNVKNILSEKWKNKNIIVLEHPAYDFGKIEMPRTLSQTPTFLFFGRIVKYKGLDLFLKSLEIFDKKIKEQNKNYKIIIAGDGKIEEEYLEIIKNNKNIELINRYIDESEIPEIWNRSDICVLPYIEASQSGVIAIAINKAMPCIITPMSGLKEQVEINNNSFALITKDLSSESLSEKMLEVLNKDIYEKLSNNAIRIQDKYSWKPWIDYFLILKK